MVEMIEESAGLESATIGIYRTATVAKGGRRFSFGALVVVGDRNGNLGLGYGKAPGVPAAIEKAQKDAKKNIVHVTLQGGTIPHQVTGKFSASTVRLIPAAPGTGVIAGATVRAVLEMAGIHDCLTKAYGSTNQKNLSKACLAGLLGLRSKAVIAALRGVELGQTETELRIAAGERYAPSVSSTDVKAAAPVNKVGEKNKQKGGRRGQSGARGKGKAGEAATAAPEAAKATEAPATDAPKAE